MVVNANEIKRHGVSLFDKLFKKIDDIISVRGKKKYTVINYEEKYREYQLDRAYEEMMEDIKNGNYKVVSAKNISKNSKETYKLIETVRYKKKVVKFFKKHKNLLYQV